MRWSASPMMHDDNNYGCCRCRCARQCTKRKKSNNKNAAFVYSLIAIIGTVAWWCNTAAEAFAFLPPQHHVKSRSSGSIVGISDVVGRSRRLFSSSTQREEQQLSLGEEIISAGTTTTTQPTSGNNADWIARSLNRRAEDDDEQQQQQQQERDSSPVIGPGRVLIYDTTLRDGTQGESISASADDKLKIAQRLGDFNVDYIEAGWPGSNPKDVEFFERARTELTSSARDKLAAFGSTRRKNIKAADDPQVQALLQAKTPTVCIVAKSHSWQVTEILRATPQENLNMISDTVRYLTQTGNRRVFVDLEHFFDGYLSDPEYALRCCRAAVDAGASALVLCDTNGGTMPWQVSEICQNVVREFGSAATIGIHCHNDCNMAVANSVVACVAGCGMIQGTINGIGERTGNADLCSIIPSLALKRDTNTTMSCRGQLTNLTVVSHYVDEILNRSPNPAAPFVGHSAFAHKGGLHVAAMERSPLSYQHVNPECVGNKQRVLISELSGKQNIMGKLEQVIGVDHFASPAAAADRASAILRHVKQLEAAGYTFEGAEASVHLMILHASPGYCPPFRVLDYSAHVYDSNLDSASRVLAAQRQRASQQQDHKDGKNMNDRANTNNNLANGGVDQKEWGVTARATIKVRTMQPPPQGMHDDEASLLPYVDHLQVGDGSGPLHALAVALRRALEPSHPSLKTVELVDYKVRIMGSPGVGATTRVMVDFRDKARETTWTTVAVDANVISASLNALIDGYEYALIEYANSCMLCDDPYY